MLLAKCAAAGMESGLFRSKYIWDKKYFLKLFWIWQRFWNVSTFHLSCFIERILKDLCHPDHGIYISRFLSCNIEHSANEGKNNESLDDRILISEDIEGHLSYSVVAPLKKQVPRHSPRLGYGVPGEDLILPPASTATMLPSRSPPVTKKSWPMLTPFSPELAAGRRPASFQDPGLV